MATSVSAFDEALERLASSPAIGYLSASAVASEPTALAALALERHGYLKAAQEAAAALVKLQGADGAVGVRAGEATPGWPTSLAMVAWRAVGNALCGVPPAAERNVTPAERHRGCSFEESAERHRGRSLQDAGGRSLQERPFQENIDRAAKWLLTHRGETIEQSSEFGHNTTMVGWAYAEQTHSWVEPTALAVLALKAAGKGEAPEAREGVALLIDRQLPGGGLNYGNTFVLGQLIRPHVQPTGMALLALAGERDTSGRIAKSIAWLRRNIGPQTTPLSLGWAVLGLKAQGVELAMADEWVVAAVEKVRGGSPHKLALLALAAKGWPV